MPPTLSANSSLKLSVVVLEALIPRSSFCARCPHSSLVTPWRLPQCRGSFGGIGSTLSELLPILTDATSRDARTTNKLTKLSGERGLYLLCASGDGKWWHFKCR